MSEPNELKITINDKTVESARAAIPEDSAGQAARSLGSAARDMAKELRKSFSIGGDVYDNPKQTGETGEPQQARGRRASEVNAEYEADIVKLREAIEKLKKGTEELVVVQKDAARSTEQASRGLPTERMRDSSNSARTPQRASGSAERATGEAPDSTTKALIANRFLRSFMNFVGNADVLARPFARRPGDEKSSESMVVKRRLQRRRSFPQSNLIKKRRLQDRKSADGLNRSPKRLDFDLGSSARGIGRWLFDAMKSAPSNAAKGFRSARATVGKLGGTYSRIGRFAMDNLKKGNLQRATGRVISGTVARSRAAFTASMGASRAAGSVGAAAGARALGAGVAAAMTGAVVATGGLALVALALVAAFTALVAAVRLTIAAANEMRERLKDYMPQTAVAEARGSFNTQVSRLRSGLREDSAMAGFRESQLRIGLAFEKISDLFTGAGVQILGPFMEIGATILEILVEIIEVFRQIFDFIIGLPRATMTLLYDTAVEPVLAKLIEIYNAIPFVDDIEVKDVLKEIRDKMPGGDKGGAAGGGAVMDPWLNSLLFGVGVKP